MVAARSALIIDLTKPSGTDNAWSMMDSPILGRMSSFNKGKAPTRSKPVPAPLSIAPVNLTSLPTSSAGVTPPEVKKIRRRGLMTDVQLNLPPTPQPPLRTPQALTPVSPSPQTALTFTAEWDLSQRAFVFTPFETSYPLSATSLYPSVSPVPDDVASMTDTVAVAETAGAGPEVEVEVTPASPSSSVTTPCSDIFDDVSIYSQDDMKYSAPSPASPPSMSPPGLYSKSEGSSSSLHSREITLHLFEEELHRFIHSDTNESGDSDFDRGCYEEMDEDLLLAPMSVFEQMLWDSAIAESRRSALSSREARAPDSPSDILPLCPPLSLRPKMKSIRTEGWTSIPPPSSPLRDTISPPKAPAFSHSRTFSFPSLSPRRRPKGPRLRRNVSVDMRGTFVLVG